MFNPRSTYRIQFHKDFDFKAFEKIIPYLQKLGINTVYASPVFKATPGSMHGYDVTDPHQINPEIGTYDQLQHLKHVLKEHKMNWIQDIVPNHMAYHSENAWLMDVLENGPQSKYVDFFDITWSSELYHGRVMVPFLGSPVDEVIENGELKVGTGDDGTMSFKYYDDAYPLHLRSYLSILTSSAQNATSVTELLEQGNLILKVEDPAEYSNRFVEFKLQFASLLKKDTEGAAIQKEIEKVNKSPEKLKKISDEQVYQLCFWQETNSRINFRRFFTINGLICLNIQNPEVFKSYHKLISEFYESGAIQGLRVDHVDGMYDPTAYLEQLRALTGDDAYIVVEKILEHEEDLPKKWPVQGNTGYDFLSWTNNIFSNRNSHKNLTSFYHELTGDKRSVEERIEEKKENILTNRLAGELDNLYDLFLEQSLVDKDEVKSLSPKLLKKTIAEFLILCPVYRYYGNKMPLNKKEAGAIKDILKQVRKEYPELSPGADLLEKAFLKYPSKGKKEYNHRAAHFYQRLMQFTGPLMAKGVEDTLMYTYSRFIGHNEVGDSPSFFGSSPDEFHERMVERQKKWPLTMNTTSTHDTKRGEDVRMRLNVLSDLYPQWIEIVRKWRKINNEARKNNIPDANDEYFIYQTIIGAYPMPGEGEDDFGKRMEEYIPKALREAKRHSNWTEPDEEYEKGSIKFVKSLLKKESEFLKSFKGFHKKISDFGIINSLSQVLLKYTCPGTPDLYQGCELWDLSLVDPDNRRPVDYSLREKMLKKIEKAEDQNKFITELWDKRYSGNIKLWLTHILLNIRKGEICNGEYIPVKVKGAYKNHVLSYCRRNNDDWLLVVVPLNIAVLAEQQDVEPDKIDWANTKIKLPKQAPGEWHNPLKGELVKGENEISIQNIFEELPLFIATASSADKFERTAGVLLHITSLPSKFGVGDLGPEAYSFADFLQRSGQSYWQILPLNPTGPGQSYSPYSSDSSMAGNIFLISPELLVEDGLLAQEDIEPHVLQPTGKAQFDKAEGPKKQFLEKAYENFQNNKNTSLNDEFERFKNEEDFWLEDYSLFVALKENFENKGWFQWPDKYKQRDKKALEKFRSANSAAIEKIKWFQFIFSRQWKMLKTYCNKKEIKLFGDLPFYISHDSVDVWANSEIFQIDKKGNMTGVAGVPPDYFNDNGQLWGMPVFKWEKLKKQNYKWWVDRIKKNMELYDLLRLDHFRAFSDFWEVPAGEETAIHGVWHNGPGENFFKVIKKELGELPFVAEDLGDINDAVYELRDKFTFPGMKVIQFAFGDDLPESPHISHNYRTNFIAYTGTHDNNTTVGWYRKDISQKERNNLKTYTGSEVNEENVHEVLIREIYSSVAKIVVVPMQDILGLNESHRMNMPATTKNNWLWQMEPGQVNHEIEEWLRNWTKMYNRR